MSKVDIVRKAINEMDPVGLLRAGCPVDEYDPEIGRVYDQLKDDMTADEICGLLFSVFSYFFDPMDVGDRSDYENAAKVIYGEINV